jgi:hypothetical protein
MHQNKSDRINLILFFEKKKNASPTIPYNFTKTPKTIKNADQKSFPFSMYTKLRIMIAVIIGLNCNPSNVVKSSCKQIQRTAFICEDFNGN